MSEDVLSWFGTREHLDLVRDALLDRYLLRPSSRASIRRFAIDHPEFGLVIDDVEPARDEDR